MSSPAEEEVYVEKSKVPRILIAEDSELFHKIYGHFLPDSQYNITIVANGLELLKSYIPRKFDVIITDGSMPEMSGYEAVRQLIERYGKSTLPPIIAVTSNTSFEEAVAFLKAGVDAFLSKPIDKKALIIEIDRLIAKAASKSNVFTEVKATDIEF
jgi:CheY-like chemotaxis protein